MKKYYGEEFINKIYKNLFESDIVKRSGKGANKNEDVSLYFDRLERISRKTIERDKYDKIKRYYYKKYVISPNDVPDSYFKNQEQIALDRGYGHVQYDENTKNREIEVIIKEQKESLDSWLDYFACSDTEHYPTWFKYFCFQGMIRIGYFDKEKNQYTKRTKNTIKPFIEINREAIAMVYDLLMKYLKKESLGDKSLEQLINSGSFSKMYAYCIRKLDSIKKNSFNSDDGIWKKYNQGSDPNILFNDIHGKGTGWCTAGGIETAKKHIDGGDFYVYYTKDEKGEYTNPRIAIRTENGKLAEVRGIAENQNLESNMEKVVEEKLKEFPDAEAYKKKVKDMEMLTYIYTKWQQKLELTKEDLRFLYEIDSKIIGFGYKEDPRIKEIIETRDKKIDFSKILDCKKNQISLTEEEALKGNIIYHCGFLGLGRLTSAEGLILPKRIIGSLALGSLTSAEGLTFPQSIEGSLDLGSLTSAEGLTLPQSIGGNLLLERLTSAEGLTLPQSVGGSLVLGSLTSAEGLTLPQSVGDDLWLHRLTSAEGLTLPQSIGGDLVLSSLTSAEGLILPQNFGGTLYLDSLTSVEGLILPQSVGGNLGLSSLISAEGLTLPQSIGGDLALSSLTSAEGLILPQNVGGNLWLSSLTSAEGLILPQNFGGNLWLSSLTSAEGLILPQNFGGNLRLSSLTSAEGLILPQNIGALDLSSLTSAEGLILPQSIEGFLDLGSLTSAKGLILPQSVGGNLRLSSLTSAKGLTLPQSVGGYLYLRSLTSAEGLIIPDTLNCDLICPLANNDINILKEMCKKNNKKI